MIPPPLSLTEDTLMVLCYAVSCFCLGVVVAQLLLLADKGLFINDVIYNTFAGTKSIEQVRYLK